MLLETGLRDHIVLAGAGRVGLQIAQVLHRLGFSIVIVELDSRRVEQAQEAGMPVIFGDASHEIVLEAASIGAARLLVVSTPEMMVTRSIVVHARARNPRIEVVARTSDPHFMAVFKELSVRDVVLPRATSVGMREDPPYDTSGSGTPVIGMRPRTAPMLSRAWVI